MAAMSEAFAQRTRISSGHALPGARACRRFAWKLALAMLMLLGGCLKQEVTRPTRGPVEVRTQVLRNIPAQAVDREGWATDIYAAFMALQIETSVRNICAALAVAAQESSFNADPAVPGLGRIARAEIDRRGERHHVPQLLVKGALLLESPNGQNYGVRIDGVRTERELSLVY